MKQEKKAKNLKLKMQNTKKINMRTFIWAIVNTYWFGYLGATTQHVNTGTALFLMLLLFASLFMCVMQDIKEITK